MDKSAPALQSSGSTYSRQGRTHPGSKPGCKRTTSPSPLQANAQGFTVEEVGGLARISMTCTDVPSQRASRFHSVRGTGPRPTGPSRCCGLQSLAAGSYRTGSCAPASQRASLTFSCTALLTRFWLYSWRWYSRSVHPPLPANSKSK
jgi:hypothetical protein